MQQIFLFLGKYQGLFYLLLILAGLSSVRWLWKAWKEWRAAYFGLEREMAMRRLAQSGAATALILTLMCGVFFIATFVVPSLPAEALIATLTLDILSTPGAAIPAGDGSLVPLTPIALATAPGSEGCVKGQLEITSPRPNSDVSGSVTLVGTVNLPNLGFYKYELSLRGTEIWNTISADSVAKINEELGKLNATVWTPGDYLLRVVVLDNDKQVIGTCTISIRIIGQ